MGYIKPLFVSFFCALLLVSCKGAAIPASPERSASCVLEGEGYSIRVCRGEARFEFISPAEVSGMTVSFNDDGSCAITTPGSKAASEASQILPGEGIVFDEMQDARASDVLPRPEGDVKADGITAPIPDGRGYHDWLVLAYPEDYVSEGTLGAEGDGQFELEGAVFSFSADGACSVTRGGLERTATRTDDGQGED